jgi:UDP-glucose 4-epimerase
MKILVTGGAGFIGSHLIDRVIKQKNEVILLDNLRSGKKENIKQHFNNKKFYFVIGDITDKKIYGKLSNSIDVVFHLAGLTNVAESVINPELYFNVNVLGSLNVLEFCRKNDIKKIIFTSSAAVYGNSKRAYKENDICKPISPYGKYKLLVEELIKSYNEFYGLNYAIFRLFNVFGPRATSGVIKILMDCVKNNRPFYLYGNGKQKRDFIFVEDVVNILSQHTKVRNTVLNLGTGKAISINQLVNLFNKLSKNKVKVIKKEKRKGDIQLSCADTKNFKKIFPKNSFTSLKKGILNYLTIL